jgi:hypothetical protein
MIDRFKEIIYIVSKKLDKTELTESDFKKSLAYDRQWLSPDHVKKFLDICLEIRLLQKENDNYVPTFSLKDIQVTLDTKISDVDIDEYKAPTPQKDLFIEILEFIEQKASMQRNEIVKNVNKIKGKMKFVNIEVAALIYAKELNLDISQFIDPVKNKIFESTK